MLGLLLTNSDAAVCENWRSTKLRFEIVSGENLGDIDSRLPALTKVGLLHPIVVRPDGRLIAGERRLAACKKLGWTSVPVTFVDLKEVIRGEFAENAHRKDFLPSEIDAIRRALLPLEKASAKGNMAVPHLAARNTPGKFPGVMAA